MSYTNNRNLLKPNADQIKAALLRSLNLPSLCMGLASVMAGCVAAYVHNNFQLLPALVCAVFVCMAQITANISYKYFALLHNFGEGTDNTGHTWRETLLPVYKAVSVGLLLVTVLIGLAIMELSGWWSIGLAAIIVLLAWMDMAPPLALVRTPFGILITFLLFGPVGVIGSSLAQSQMGTMIPFNEFDLMPAMILSLRVGLMMVCCHLSFCYVAYRYDLRNSKRTFTVTFGRKVARATYLACAILAYFIFFWMCLALDFRYVVIDMIPPTIYTLWLVRIWWYMGHGTHKKELIVKGTLYATLAVTFVNFILFNIIQIPDWMQGM
ncbi:MAG: prenyltransferase [Muribaculaceae bacterium]|nr:prenyltransferase [Muribaculaceae bacterium]